MTKSVKLGGLLAATFFNISAENYTNTLLAFLSRI